MNGLKAMNHVLNRAWRTQAAALVLTLLVFLLAVTTTARAQGAGKVSMRDFGFTVHLGVARGQMLRITLAIPNNQNAPNGRLYVGTDLGVFVSHVKVFDAVTNAEITSFELRNPTPGVHMFDIGGNGRDILFGGENGDRNRVQLRIEMKLVVCYDRSTNEIGAGFFPPTFELVDKDSGRTTVAGGLVKVGPGTLTLSAANTY